MAKYEQRKANKDYPENGIKKGDTYYYCNLKTGPRSSRVMRQLKPFTRSQLTTSDYYQAVWSLFDDADPQTPDDVRDMAETLRGIGEEQQEKFDNMPEGLQQGDTGQMLENRAQSCDSQASELDQIADEWEQAIEEYDNDEEAKELDEDEREEFDASDFISRVSECEPED